MPPWKLYQYNSVVDEFWASCTEKMREMLESRLGTLSENGISCGMPVSLSLGGGLLELRGKAERVQFRLLYFFQQGARIVVVDAFRKTTKQEQSARIKVARIRKRDIEEGKVTIHEYDLAN